MRNIPPIKTYNRMPKDLTKDEIEILVNQDDNLTWCKGYPIIKDKDIKRVKAKK